MSKKTTKSKRESIAKAPKLSTKKPVAICGGCRNPVGNCHCTVQYTRDDRLENEPQKPHSTPMPGGGVMIDTRAEHKPKPACAGGYSQYYRDSRWQQKRLEIMERDGWKCRSCGKGGEGVTLNVHHAYYEKGKKPWEYDGDMLVTWCEKCHEWRHSIMKGFQVWIAGQPGAVVNGVWVLSYFNMFNTLMALQPGMSDDLTSRAIEIVSESFNSGVECGADK